MIKLRVCPAVAVLATVLFSSTLSLHAALPDYKLGDVAAEDVITPVQLLVVNPEATEALKQKVAQQVPSIVRRTVPATAEAEAELRTSIATARTAFLAALQLALQGRIPGASDVDTPAYVNTVRDAVRGGPKNLPFSRLAPLWVRGVSDETLIDNLLQPVREAMAQPIVIDKSENPLPPNQPVRLIQVQNPLESPSMQELEINGVTITAGKVISLGRARRVVETYFFHQVRKRWDALLLPLSGSMLIRHRV